MNTVWEQLVTNLESHLSGYEELYELLKLEQKALLDHNLEAIQKLSKVKEDAVLKIQAQLDRVTEAITALVSALNYPAAGRPSLAQLAQAAPDPVASRINSLRLAIERLKRWITSQNEANQNYVKESLFLINEAIAVLTGAAVKPKTRYLASGLPAPASGHRPIRLDREV